MKTYINPFAIFDLRLNADKTEIYGNDLQNLNQRLDPILSNKQDSVILWTGYRLAKTEIIQLSNELNNPQTRLFHLLIQQDRSLLHFLEYGHPSYLEQDKENWDNLDPDFQNFILPYFRTQWIELWNEAEQKGDSQQLSLLLNYNHLVPEIGLKTTTNPNSSTETEEEENEEEKNEENTPIDEELLGHIHDLRQIKSRQNLSFISEREFISYLNTSIINRFNAEEVAQTTRNSLAKEAILLIRILLEEYGRRDAAEALLKQLNKLKLNEKLSEQLNSLSQQYLSRKRILPLWLLIGLAVIGLLFLLKYIETSLL